MSIDAFMIGFFVGVLCTLVTTFICAGILLGRKGGK